MNELRKGKEQAERELTEMQEETCGYRIPNVDH